MNNFVDEDPITPQKGSAVRGEDSSPAGFRQPSSVAALFNRLIGFLAGHGFGPKEIYLLEVRGRKSGRVYSTPVSLLAFGGKEFLVAPRGRTQWVRNAEAAGEISLKRGKLRREFRLRLVPDAERIYVLKAYLDGFTASVQRYFPIPAGSPATAFVSIAAYYPVFELFRP